MNNGTQQKELTMPKVCVVCGKDKELSLVVYKATYVPPLAYLLILVGIIFGAIIIAFLKRKYSFSVYYCSSCLKHNNYKQKLIHYTTMFSSITCLIMGPILGLMYSSWFIGLGGLAVSITIAILAGEYQHIISPKIVKYGKGILTLDIPNYGLLEVYFPNK